MTPPGLARTLTRIEDVLSRFGCPGSKSCREHHGLHDTFKSRVVRGVDCARSEMGCTAARTVSECEALPGLCPSCALCHNMPSAQEGLQRFTFEVDGVIDAPGPHLSEVLPKFS